MSAMLEWIINCYDYIKLHGLYVDRGDPAGAAFTLVNLTTDGNWHDLDLSNIVPAGARVVYIKVLAIDNLITSFFRLRKKGQVNARNVRRLDIQVANTPINLHAWILLDANRIIEYAASNTVWSIINIDVLAWSY